MAILDNALLEEKRKTEAALAYIEKHPQLDPLHGFASPRSRRSRVVQKAQLVWHRGFVRGVSLLNPRNPKTLSDFLRHLSLRFLRDLKVEIESELDDKTADTVDGLLARPPGTLQRLSLEGWGELRSLWMRLPALSHVEVTAHELNLGKVRAPRLERAVFSCYQLTAAACRAIAAAEIPRVRHLSVTLSAPPAFDWLGNCSVRTVRPLLARSDLRDLRFLGLKQCDFADDLARALNQAPILASLDHLDLSGGNLTDDGAEALVLAVRSLRHLKVLDLSDNFLSRAGVRTVGRICRRVVTRGQTTENRRYRFTVE